MTHTVALADFLTKEQIAAATALHRQYLKQLVLSFSGASDLHKTLLEKIIQPNMAAIDQKLGQKNDPDYLAYALEFALTHSTPKRPA